MNGHLKTQYRKRAAVVAVVTLLAGGATWHGWAAEQSATESTRTVVQAPAATTPVPLAIAGGRDSYADVVAVVSPAVVTVHVQGRARVSPTQFQRPDDEFFGQFFGNRAPPAVPRQRQQALGSGVVVTNDGYILTNNHVVEGADNVSVDFTDGRTLTARVIGTDRPSDLALLKVNGTNFRTVSLGNSDNVHVGDVVLAVGNPLNIGQTVTMGIISAKGRSTGVGDGSYEDFLQTDAPINHGNSGGALVNTRGELIGINSQILSNSDGNIGIGFAIPSNMARRAMDDLRTKGKVTRAQLGVSVQNVSADMAASLGLRQAGGVIVSGVTPGSAADRAGLERGDVIQALNGQPVRDMNALRNRVAETSPNSTADLLIVRNGAEKHISARLDELATRSQTEDVDRNTADESDRTGLGVAVAPLTPELASRLGVPPGTKGLVVQEVDPDGRAMDAGIRSGDVIQEVNRRQVDSVADLRAALRQTGNKPALLLINRQGASIFVTVKPANG